MKITNSNKNDLRGDLSSDVPRGEDHSLENSSAIATYSPPASPPQERKSHLRMVVLFSGLIMALLTGLAIGGLSVRKAQYEKIDQARFAFNEACHTETLANSEALSLAKQNWIQAENLLQTVPPLPALGFKDAQKLKSTFNRCKLNIDANSNFQDAAQLSAEARIAVTEVEGLPEETWTEHLRQINSSIEHLGLIQAAPQDLPIFAEAQGRLEEYQNIRTQIQNRLKEQQQAVENFNTAKEFYEQFQAQKVSSDAVSYSAAEKALNSAISYLHKIPPEGTTVSAIAVGTLGQYEQELADFRVEPVRQNLRWLAANFAQLSRDLQINLTFDDNTLTILGNLANQVAQFQQEPSISSHPAMVSFEAALEDYQLAQHLWQDCNEQTPRSELCFRNGMGADNLYLAPASRFHNRLVDYYKVTPWLGLGWIRQKAALEKVFEHAQQNLEQANELIRD
jgi:hypothetical protein